MTAAALLQFAVFAGAGFTAVGVIADSLFRLNGR
jgi:hypothetical protein